MENLNTRQKENFQRYIDYIKSNLFDYKESSDRMVIYNLHYGVKTCLVQFNIDFELFKPNFEATFLIFKTFFIKFGEPFSDRFKIYQEKEPPYRSFMDPSAKKNQWYYDPLWFYAGFPEVAKFNLKNRSNELWPEFKKEEKNIPEFLFLKAVTAKRSEFRYLFFLIDYYKKNHSNGRLAFEMEET